CGLELGRRGVDADDPRPVTGKPGGHVGGAAPELDDIEAGDVVRQHAELRLGPVPDTPEHVVAGPGPGRLRVRVLGVRTRPDRTVDRDGVRLRRAHRRTTTRPRGRPT